MLNIIFEMFIIYKHCFNDNYMKFPPYLTTTLNYSEFKALFSKRELPPFPFSLPHITPLTPHAPTRPPPPTPPPHLPEVLHY